MTIANVQCKSNSEAKKKSTNSKLNVKFDESKYISHSIYVTHSQFLQRKGYRMPYKIINSECARDIKFHSQITCF